MTLTQVHALQLLAASREELKRLGVEKMAFYGSVARDEATAQSDVDVLVDLADERLTLVGYMDLCFFLENLFGRRVNVTTFRSLKPHMKDRVLAEAVHLELRDSVPAASNPDA